MELIDTHAHLDDERFAEDLEEVLARATAAGVVRVLTIGIDRSTSEAAVILAREHALLGAVVGIQPNHAGEVAPGDWDTIVELAKDPHTVAIGETGLDRYWDRCPFPVQEQAFRRHLQLCKEFDKPIVIHSRDCDTDMVRVLGEAYQQHGPIRGVMHSFTGTTATAAACVGFGLHISFAGMVTYKSAASLRAVAAEVPADRLLVETDCPYLAPVPMRGQRNEPAFVVHTAACLAEIRQVGFQEIAALTTQNARSLFGL